MNGLFRLVQNFILWLLLGKDSVCTCVCGRNELYYITHYDVEQPAVDTSKNYIFGDTMSQQGMDVLAGLLSGLFISWFLMWLDRVWHSTLKDWTLKQWNDMDFWSMMPKFSKTKDLSPPSSPRRKKKKSHTKKEEYHCATERI